MMTKLDRLIAELCPDLPAARLPDGQGRQVGWSNPDDLPQGDNTWYVYILLCENGSLYKGFTKNLKKRYIRHCSGEGSVHTKKYKPICVLYYETFLTEQEAVVREKYLKSGSGREKLKEMLRELPHVQT